MSVESTHPRRFKRLISKLVILGAAVHGKRPMAAQCVIFRAACHCNDANPVGAPANRSAGVVRDNFGGNPFAASVVKSEQRLDPITQQLLFGLDGQGGFIPGAFRAAERTFFDDQAVACCSAGNRRAVTRSDPGHAVGAKQRRCSAAFP